MKYILFLSLFVILPSFASQICGPTVTNLEYSYTVETPKNQVVGHWAIGMGCANGEYVGDINASCTTIVATGYAVCEKYDGRGTVIGNGWYCGCIRSAVGEKGDLIDLPGAYVRLGVTDRDTALCQANCTRMCVQAIVNNTNGIRNSIMTLPE